nr:hypothetical protein [Anaerolineae bacterium]
MDYSWLHTKQLLICATAVLLAGCTTAPAPTPTPTPRDDSAIRQALVTGVHADTYSLETGPNTYCAVCKSPANWDPQAVIDDPPNCVSCKFASDANMRVAVGNPVVPENQWEGIRCYNCHPVGEDNVAEEALAWWDAETDTHVFQENSTMLCEQCHRDSPAGTTRQRELADSTAHASATCTTCHDPHDGTADCSDCHHAEDTETDFVNACWAQYLAPDAPAHHTDLLCQTCHDAGGLELRPVQDPGEPYPGQWATWRNTLIAGSIPSNHVWVSHNLSAEVDCSRCHYDGNPWELAADVGTASE